MTKPQLSFNYLMQVRCTAAQRGELRDLVEIFRLHTNAPALLPSLLTVPHLHLFPLLLHRSAAQLHSVVSCVILLRSSACISSMWATPL